MQLSLQSGLAGWTLIAVDLRVSDLHSFQFIPHGLECYDCYISGKLEEESGSIQFVLSQIGKECTEKNKNDIMLEHNCGNCGGHKQRHIGGHQVTIIKEALGQQELQESNFAFSAKVAEPGAVSAPGGTAPAGAAAAAAEVEVSPSVGFSVSVFSVSDFSALPLFKSASLLASL
jgi:Zn finger protein HypA/HybF involved in hydrogenase expression